MSARQRRILRLYVPGLCVLAGAALTWLVWTSLNRLPAPRWGTSSSPSAGRPCEIAGSGRVAQTFTAPLPGLSSVVVVLEAPSSGSASPVTVRLMVGDVATGKELMVRSAEPTHFPGAVSYRFDFARQAGSRGQAYTLFLSAGQQEDPAAPPLTARCLPEAHLEGAQLYLDGKAQPGALEFNTRYTLTAPQRLGRLIERMADGRPGLMGEPGLYAGVGVACAAVTCAVLWATARRILADTEAPPAASGPATGQDEVLQ